MREESGMRSGWRGRFLAYAIYGTHQVRFRWCKFRRDWPHEGSKRNDYGSCLGFEVCINSRHPESVQRSTLFSELVHVVEEATCANYSHSGDHTKAEGIYQILAANPWLIAYLWPK